MNRQVPSKYGDEEQAHFGGNDIGWQALGPAIGCVLLATTVVAARWFARRRLAQCEGIDDYVILVSLLLSWAMTGLVAAEVNGGSGIYSGPLILPIIAQLVIASNCLWILTTNITKASILIQYLRIFDSRTLRLLSYTFLLLLLPAASWAIFGGIFLCTPTAKLWHPSLPGHCLSAQKYWLSVAGIDIGLDFLILLLPLPAIADLHLPRKQKLGLVLVFTLGFFVCIVSVARLLTVLLASQERHYIASGVWAIVWSAVEANVGIICASLLSLKPLVVRLFPGVARERRPAKHSMRIPYIGAEGSDGMTVTMKETSRSGTATNTTSTTVPPSSARSNQSSAFRRPVALGGSRFGSAQPLAEMEGIRVIEAERPGLPGPQVSGSGGLSLFDMLAEDVPASQQQPGRRLSSQEQV